MKKKVIIIAAVAAAAVVAVTVFFLTRGQSGKKPAEELTLNGSAYTLVQGWEAPDGEQGRDDKASSGNEEYDVEVYGDNSEFITVEYYDSEKKKNVTLVYRDSSAAPHDISEKEIKEVYVNYGSEDVKADPSVIEKVTALISDGEYSSEKLEGARFLYTVKAVYNDSPMLCSLGAVVGVEDKYYFRLDFVDGKYTGEKRFYPVEADFFK